MGESISARLSQRQANLCCSPLPEEQLKSRDSSLKKITPFLKKVKERLGEESVRLCAEVGKLNLSKYVEEVATGVLEARIKLSEIPAVVELISLMHRSYSSFTPALQPQLLKLAGASAPPPPRGSTASPESDADRTARLIRKRSLLRLAFELFVAGVISPLGPVLKLLQATCEEDLATADPLHPHLSIVSALAKYICNDPLAISPLRGQRSEGGEEGGEEGRGDVGDDESVAVTPVLSSVEQAAVLKILRDYSGAVAKSLHATHAQLLRIERANQKVLANKGELSEESLAAYERVLKLHDKLVSGVGALCEALHDEAPVLVDDKEEEKEKVQVSIYGPGSGSDGLELFEDEDLRTLYEQLPDLKSVLPAVLFADPKEGKADSGSGEEIEQLLTRLPVASTREQVDSLASELVCAGGRFHVRKLVRALLQPPRRVNIAEGTPLYGRLAAMRESQGGRDLSARLANIQYIAELIKFRVLPTASAFKCLKDMLDSFSPANVQLLVKMRSVHRLPGEHFTMIDNAVNTCKPSDRSAMVQETRPPLHQYVIWLLHSHLSRTTVERVVKQLRKLEWEDEEVCDWVHHALLDCASVKYHTIHLVACVVSGLARYHESEMYRLVDAVIERARLAVDLNDFRDAQRRACLLKLLGELYNYQMIDASVIFRRESIFDETLIPLLTPPQEGIVFGATPTARPLLHERERMVDGPSDSSRLRLVCVLLDTCGQFFCRGAAKRKLDVFLSLGVEMEFALSDTLSALRPKLVRPSSYQEASAAVARLSAKLAEDQKKGEALAHELLHSATVGGEVECGDEAVDDEEGEGDDRGELGEEGEEDKADEDMEAELAEVRLPASDTLAKTVIRMEDKAAEERQRLKAPTRTQHPPSTTTCELCAHASGVCQQLSASADETERDERVLAAAADQESGGSRGSYITKIQQSPVLPEVNLHNQRKNNR
ncbi:MAG: hypothetical protein SGPRY_000918 [Prymnesium sp.]